MARRSALAKTLAGELQRFGGVSTCWRILRLMTATRSPIVMASTRLG